jgi:hypothetical protein
MLKIFMMPHIPVAMGTRKGKLAAESLELGMPGLQSYAK